MNDQKIKNVVNIFSEFVGYSSLNNIRRIRKNSNLNDFFNLSIL